MQDFHLLFAQLSEQEKEFITEKQLSFHYNEYGDGFKKISAVFEKDEEMERNTLRYSHNLLRYGQYDPDMRSLSGTVNIPKAQTDIADRLHDLFYEHCHVYEQEKHALLILDNNRFLHARESYTDTARKLLRYYISVAY